MKPDNNCGECIVWLALGEDGGITREEAIEKHCYKCQVFKNKVED